MYLDRLSAVHPETRLIARDTPSLQQWEAVVSADAASSSQHAWLSRPLSSWSHWLAQCWESARSSGALDRKQLLLSSRQVDRLWRRVIEESEQGEALVSSGGVAAWAKAARQSLFEYGLAPDEQGGCLWQDDAAAFLNWNRRFEATLNRNDWVDPDSLLSRINRLPADGAGHDLVLLDPLSVSPETEMLLVRWRAAGHSVEIVEPDDHKATLEARIAADPADELRQAADWAARRLQAQSGIRIAVVVPDFETRRDAVESIFEDTLGAERIMGGGRPVADIAACGAALTAIRLLSAGADFEVLSRWLRSPFFSSDDESRERNALALELTLRSEPRAQRDFVMAWRRLGLKSVFQKPLPDTTRQLDEAFDRLPHRATPTTWAAVWQSCLKTLGWHGFEPGLPGMLQAAWDNTWAAFSELTPVVGPMDMQSAFDEFDRIASSQSVVEPMRLGGVHLMSRISQIGPGYRGAWISGATAEAIPQPGTSNPFLPWAVQATHSMPGANPDLELDASRKELHRLMRRVPEAVFSCPARNRDQPQMPSPLVGGWRQAGIRLRAGEGGQSYTGTRMGARAWEDRCDQAPALTGNKIPGGTRTLDLQAACPVKAFCVTRLRASPLEMPVRGIDPRLRGVLVHRVLELLLDPKAPDVIDARFGACIEAAFTELVRVGDDCWEMQVRAERVRIERMIRAFLEHEAGRPVFRTIDVERRSDIVIDGWQLSCRIDRVDRLASGDEWLIDYKTGQSSGGGWFLERLSDCQLPVYAQHSEVAGIVAIRLSDNAIDYRATGRRGGPWPGKPRIFDEAAWEAQIGHWNNQIVDLINEFVSGDVRLRSDARRHIESDAREHAGGAYAPLTRVGDIR